MPKIPKHPFSKAQQVAITMLGSVDNVEAHLLMDAVAYLLAFTVDSTLVPGLPKDLMLAEALLKELGGQTTQRLKVMGWEHITPSGKPN